MGFMADLEYRFGYARRFMELSKVLGLPLSRRLLKDIGRGSNPKIFTDSSGTFVFNRTMADILDRYSDCRLRHIREVILSEYDVKLMAVNYKILSERCPLAVLKYFPNMSYVSRRKMNVYLYRMKDL